MVGRGLMRRTTGKQHFGRDKLDIQKPSLSRCHKSNQGGPAAGLPCRSYLTHLSFRFGFRAPLRDDSSSIGGLESTAVGGRRTEAASIALSPSVVL